MQDTEGVLNVAFESPLEISTIVEPKSSTSTAYGLRSVPNATKTVKPADHVGRFDRNINDKRRLLGLFSVKRTQLERFAYVDCKLTLQCPKKKEIQSCDPCNAPTS